MALSTFDKNIRELFHKLAFDIFACYSNFNHCCKPISNKSFQELIPLIRVQQSSSWHLFNRTFYSKGSLLLLWEQPKYLE
jgi:hypothetical protein